MPPRAISKPKGRPPKQKKEVLPIDHPIIHHCISVNGIPIPREKLKITAQKAKILVGWETEADQYNRVKEDDPTLSRGGVDFKQDFLLLDIEGNKVRCEHNATNRPFYETWSKTLCQDILNRFWRLNGETVIISDRGRVLSAQHRLIALILAWQIWKGKNHEHWLKKWPEEPFIESLVVTGIPEDQDTVNTLDNVKPRSLGDVFYTSPIFLDLHRDQKKKAARMLDKAVDFLWHRTTPTREGRGISELAGGDVVYQTHSTSAEFLDRHKKLLVFIRAMLTFDEEHALSKLKLSPGMCAAICYLQASSESNPDDYLGEDPPCEKVLTWEHEKKAIRFWEEVAKDTALFKPLQQALSALKDPDQGVGGRTIEKLCVIAKSWALFLEDMPLTLEDIMPEYYTEEVGEITIRRLALSAKRVTFGGIDFGEPISDKEIENDEGDGLSEEELEERRKAASREKSRQEMEKKIKASSKKK